MHAGSVAASLVVLLAANDTAMLDCVCSHCAEVVRARGARALSGGQRLLWRDYCTGWKVYVLSESCLTLSPPSVAAPAVSRLVPLGLSDSTSNSTPAFSWERPPPLQGRRREQPRVFASHLSPPPQLSSAGAGTGGGDDGSCGSAMAEVRRLTTPAATRLYAELSLRIAQDCLASCSPHGLNGTEWNETTLSAHHLRRPALLQLVTAVRRIAKAITSRNILLFKLKPARLKKSALGAALSAHLRDVPKHWRDTVRLLSLGVTEISRMFLPLAFEHVVFHMSDQRLHGWIKDLERVRDMLDKKLRGWLQDMQSASEQIPNYKVEADNNRTGSYLVRLPLLSESLVLYQESYTSFRGDFGPLCERRHPNASQVFGLADALYSFYYENWLEKVLRYSRRYNGAKLIDEEWQLEDRSNATVSVDTGCLQVLADTLDRPTCPLDDLPPETSKERRRCREQLWRDLVEWRPRVPVTSYLAYTQWAVVSLCLLAWMAANSRGVCRDVPFSMIQSVHDARCYFDSPDDSSCLQSNTTDALCVVSRAILLLKCRDFATQAAYTECIIQFYPDGSHSGMSNMTWNDAYKGYTKPTQKTLKYKDWLNSATLRYKDFRVDSLKPLEITFIAVNIVFRFFTAGIYMYLPHLGNLPGKILSSYQITGLLQILFSEVMYRMAGFPDLPTAVLIDSALTLLSCICLNWFCYQMFGYIRDLRLPNDLPPDVASRVFRRQVIYALIAWSIPCAACVALEKTSKYHLIYSRILFLAWISLSITFNLVFLGLVGYMYLRTKKSMRQLEIISSNKLGSKKQILYMSVKTVILSGIGVIIRVGFHQAQGIAQAVYFVHIATMMQGPVLFVFFICNGATLSALRNRVLAWWNPDVIQPGQQLCSSAERNLRKRVNEQRPVAESSL